IRGDTLLFEETAGLVRVELWRQGSTVLGARLAAPEPLVVIEEVGCEIIAEACAISAAEIEMRHHQPCIASCGLRFVFAELKDLRAMAAAQPRPDGFERSVQVDRV